MKFIIHKRKETVLMIQAAQEIELIYLYIKRYSDFIYEQGLLLSNNFNVEVQNKKLIVRRKHNYLKNFYGEKINNISVLVGKNGSGKTTLLDLLGMGRSDRLKHSIDENTVKDEYLLLYYLGIDDDGNDLFGIEVTGNNVLDNIITNYRPSSYDDERYDRSKTSIGKIYKYENDTFVSIGKHFFDYKINNDSLSEIIQYAYIGESYRYSIRNRKFRRNNDGDYLAERKLYSKAAIYQKYLILQKCINGEIQGLTCEKAIVRFQDKIDYSYELDTYISDYSSENIEKLSENLYLKKLKFTFGQKIHSTKNHKYNYILDLYSRYILDMAITGLYYTCKRNNTIKQPETPQTFQYTDDEIINYITSLGSCDSTEKRLGRPVNYEIETKNIVDLSGILKKRYKDKIKYLEVLGRYVCSRLHSDEEEAKEFQYLKSFEEIVEALLEIPENYFFSEYVEFNITKKHNPSLEKLLKIYSYYDSAGINDTYSDIGNKLNLYFELLSEGEERFIDIIAKINDCIKPNENIRLLVLLLDEPDQSLHPEWSRRFIDIITQAINSMNFEGKIQLILSTHSPYLLSDILPSDICKLNRNNVNRTLTISNTTDTEKANGLGANIYDLLNQEFFMDNTVGEFATKKINFYSKKIKELNQNSEDIPEIEYFIEQIGEPIIKNIMKKNLNAKKFASNIETKMDELLTLISNKQDRERVKAYLKNTEKKNDTY